MQTLRIPLIKPHRFRKAAFRGEYSPWLSISQKEFESRIDAANALLPHLYPISIGIFCALCLLNALLLAFAPEVGQVLSVVTTCLFSGSFVYWILASIDSRSKLKVLVDVWSQGDLTWTVDVHFVIYDIRGEIQVSRSLEA